MSNASPRRAGHSCKDPLYLEEFVSFSGHIIPNSRVVPGRLSNSFSCATPRQKNQTCRDSHLHWPNWLFFVGFRSNWTLWYYSKRCELLSQPPSVFAAPMIRSDHPSHIHLSFKCNEPSCSQVQPHQVFFAPKGFSILMGMSLVHNRHKSRRPNLAAIMHAKLLVMGSKVMPFVFLWFHFLNQVASSKVAHHRVFLGPFAGPLATAAAPCAGCSATCHRGRSHRCWRRLHLLQSRSDVLRQLDSASLIKKPLIRLHSVPLSQSDRLTLLKLAVQAIHEMQKGLSAHQLLLSHDSSCVCLLHFLHEEIRQFVHHQL